MSLPYGCQMTFPLLDCVPVQPLFLFVSSCVDFFFVCVWKGVHTAKNGFQHFYLKFVVSKACILFKKKKKSSKAIFSELHPIHHSNSNFGWTGVDNLQTNKRSFKDLFFLILEFLPPFKL